MMADGTPIPPRGGFVHEFDPDPTKFMRFPPLAPPTTPSVALQVCDIDQTWIDNATESQLFDATLARFQSMTPTGDGCILDDARYGPHVIQFQLNTPLRYFLTNYLKPERRERIHNCWITSFSQTRTPRGTVIPRISDVKFRHYTRKAFEDWTFKDYTELTQSLPSRITA